MLKWIKTKFFPFFISVVKQIMHKAEASLVGYSSGKIFHSVCDIRMIIRVNDNTCNLLKSSFKCIWCICRFDYGDKFWIIKYKHFTCTCGSSKCKYSTETIEQTVSHYYKLQSDLEADNKAHVHQLNSAVWEGCFNWLETFLLKPQNFLKKTMKYLPLVYFMTVQIALYLSCDENVDTFLLAATASGWLWIYMEIISSCFVLSVSVNSCKV